MADQPTPSERLLIEQGTIPAEQVSLILAACELVMRSPAGSGEVTIHIHDARIRLVQPAPTLDAYRPERELRWMGLEAKHRQGNR